MNLYDISDNLPDWAKALRHPIPNHKYQVDADYGAIYVSCPTKSEAYILHFQNCNCVRSPMVPKVLHPLPAFVPASEVVKETTVNPLASQETCPICNKPIEQGQPWTVYKGSKLHRFECLKYAQEEWN